MNPLAEKLLDWYRINARRLPWRDHPEAYAIWVSEIMLQQTRVETVTAYFSKWMQKYPTIHHLAFASEQEVLTVWEGLGYYNRARNLHKAAKLIVEKNDGELPRNLPDLRKLPGIGSYTAAAIVSMAFGQDVATMDGNLKRVFARLFDYDQPLGTPAAEKRLQMWAEEYLPAGKAGEYNQALMDLGATICLPKHPRCSKCPIVSFCQAQLQGNQSIRPVKKPKKSIPHHIVTAALIFRDGKYLLAKRPEKGLLGGLWEFPGGKVEPGENLQEALAREINEELGTLVAVGEEIGVFKHAYTHFRITLHAFNCSVLGNEPGALEVQEIAWFIPKNMDTIPMGKVDRLIARQLLIDDVRKRIYTTT